MTTPRLALASVDKAIDCPRRCPHKVGACLVVLRLSKCHGCELDNGFEESLHKAVEHKEVILSVEVDLDEEQKIISELKTLLILLVDYLNTTDLSSLKPIPGTAKSKKKSIYGEQDTTPTTIDGDSLKDLLKELGANVKPGYIGTTGPRPI